MPVAAMRTAKLDSRCAQCLSCTVQESKPQYGSSLSTAYAVSLTNKLTKLRSNSTLIEFIGLWRRLDERGTTSDFLGSAIPPNASAGHEPSAGFSSLAF